jgi:hypothetical protein
MERRSIAKSDKLAAFSLFALGSEHDDSSSCEVAMQLSTGLVFAVVNY